MIRLRDVSDWSTNHTDEKHSDHWVVLACSMSCPLEYAWRSGTVLGCNQGRHTLPGNGLIPQFPFHAQGQPRQFVG